MQWLNDTKERWVNLPHRKQAALMIIVGTIAITIFFLLTSKAYFPPPHVPQLNASNTNDISDAQLRGLWINAWDTIYAHLTLIFWCFVLTLYFVIDGLFRLLTGLIDGLFWLTRKLRARFAVTALTLLLCLGVSERKANAQFGGVFVCPTCSSETTQLANYAQLATQILKEAQAIEIALQTYQQIMVDGALLTDMQWGNLTQDMANLGAVIQQGQGLSYQLAALDQQFRMAYPGYADTTQPFFPQYQNWNQVLMDTLAGVGAGLNVHNQQIGSDLILLDQLHAMAGSAIGQDQAVQSGTLIADQELQQIQKLKQIMLMQTGAVMTYYGRQVNQESVAQTSQQNGFGRINFVAVN